jgi:succinyl-CoA synthetase beta subunit
VVEKTYACFVKNDAELVEINPLAEILVNDKPEFKALDAKIILDDAAISRHEFAFPQRTGFRPLTEMEKHARAIDAQSHRGVAGRTLLELDGDIAFLSSGGGASITCLDALLTYGGRPANFAEYSGNPERSKVYALAKLVLSKPGLKGLWVVGPTANFTDVYETLGGIMDAIIELKPAFPIVIRRAGPRDVEAKALVEQVAKDHSLDMVFFGEEMPMTESARVLLDKIGT